MLFLPCAVLPGKTSHRLLLEDRVALRVELCPQVGKEDIQGVDEGCPVLVHILVDAPYPTEDQVCLHEVYFLGYGPRRGAPEISLPDSDVFHRLLDGGFGENDLPADRDVIVIVTRAPLVAVEKPPHPRNQVLAFDDRWKEPGPAQYLEYGAFQFGNRRRSSLPLSNGELECHDQPEIPYRHVVQLFETFGAAEQKRAVPVDALPDKFVVPGLEGSVSIDVMVHVIIGDQDELQDRVFRNIEPQKTFQGIGSLFTCECQRAAFEDEPCGIVRAEIGFRIMVISDPRQVLGEPSPVRLVSQVRLGDTGNSEQIP
ncbi:MAG: hypothetical protein A4E57_04788 [Syntrophorhabdaceae bacterium PtaU1.Bin034]|nr:MAG: hypothetical protein A4E57_04788 [Syntrophorhabdaceae bacterium PtaU1.Bin034]